MASVSDFSYFGSFSSYFCAAPSWAFYAPPAHLRVDVEVLCSEDSQDLVQVSDPPEVQGGPVVPHLVPGLKYFRCGGIWF